MATFLINDEAPRDRHSIEAQSFSRSGDFIDFWVDSETITFSIRAELVKTIRLAPEG